MKKFFLTTCLITSLAAPLSLNAAEEAQPAVDIPWSFEGMTGTFDRTDLQHGFQIYKEVCAACHGIKRIRFRELAALGYSEEEIKAIAADYQIIDGPDDMGEMYERAGRPSDAFPSPYPNDKAARAANNGALPPDLSLIVKARANGANYIYSLLTGYGGDVPHGAELPEGMHYNPYFPGGQIAMTAPLTEDIVTYSDGTVPSVSEMAMAVTTFLAWASEPEMESRKTSGIEALIYLAVFTLLMYLVMRRVWGRLEK